LKRIAQTIAQLRSIDCADAFKSYDSERRTSAVVVDREAHSPFRRSGDIK